MDPVLVLWVPGHDDRKKEMTQEFTPRLEICSFKCEPLMTSEQQTGLDVSNLQPHIPTHSHKNI